MRVRKRYVRLLNLYSHLPPPASLLPPAHRLLDKARSDPKTQAIFLALHPYFLYPLPSRSPISVLPSFCLLLLLLLSLSLSSACCHLFRTFSSFASSSGMQCGDGRGKTFKLTHTVLTKRSVGGGLGGALVALLPSVLSFAGASFLFVQAFPRVAHLARKDCCALSCLPASL
ncbi:hypothetical protein CEXT_19501 [Caerostris extrusa]|uniref:Transmembrane protein n=1 Tax=Caerostris extrusa TaxID=172846 RepID=A0AAV4Y9F8_CAEEX|nr:hypothetical protein CEXT_19501 [Caerostris extrusa]